MLTNNFKQAMRLILANRNSRNSGGLEIKDTGGTTKYLMSLDSWPAGSSVAIDPTISSYTSPGVWIGSGTTPAAVTDYTLENRITSGASGRCDVPSNTGVDENGNPQLMMVLTITNTGSSSITVSEVGFFQNVKASTSPNSGGGSGTLVMLDRTLLNTPATIPAGESVAITYTLKTVSS